jgi:hypothetical protein
MTTLALPPSEVEPLKLDPLRLLPVAANLLPPEVTDARRGRKVRVAVIVLLVAALGGTVAWDISAGNQKSAVADQLAKVQSDNTRLIHQQSSYNELVQAQTTDRAISTQLALLMASDLQWSELVPSVVNALPVGASITTITGALAGGNAAIAQLPGITDSSAIGTITVKGSAADKVTIAAYVDALTKVSGVAAPYVTSAQQQTGGQYQFSLDLEITKAELGGRFTSTTGGK